MKRILPIIAILAAIGLAGCSEADVASRNISRAADNFDVVRRIVFINGITDKYLLTVEGKYSLGNTDKPRELSVTCKTGEGVFKKHYVGLSDNTTYVAEQLEAKSVSTYHYKVMFRPTTILPDVDLDLPGSGG